MRFHRDVRAAILGAALPLLATMGVSSAATFDVSSLEELAALEADIRAAQFLSRATFGPTKADIELLSARIEEVGERQAFSDWIDDQFEIAPTYHEPLAKNMILADGYPENTDPDRETYFLGSPSSTRYRHYAWWDAAIAAPDQLRQRVAWALAQIFVINEISSGSNSRSLDEVPSQGGGDSTFEPRYLGVVDYYDLLVRNAFGGYRQTLEDVTYHPVMGVFLSHRGNRKADPDAGTFPDENYAREILQLFSIGIYKLRRNGSYFLDWTTRDPVPSYDNDDIETLARVFTGLDYYGGRQNFHAPMESFEDRHDTGEKRLLGGLVIPAGGTVDEDITAVLDHLARHRNTSLFISRLLIQRLVKSNPSSRYLRAVAQAFQSDDGTGHPGNFKAAVKEILLNSEALDSYKVTANSRTLTLTVEGGGTEHSRLQEPVVRYAAFIRAFDAVPILVDGDQETEHHFAISDRSRVLNQEAYRSPSVFNFYLPDHVPQGELQHYNPRGRFPNNSVSAPEFQILTPVAVNSLANALRNDVNDAELDLSIRLYDRDSNTPLKIRLDFSDEIALAADPAALVRHLNILMCHGSLGDAGSANLAAILESETTDEEVRAEGAILALLTAPDCTVYE